MPRIPASPPPELISGRWLVKSIIAILALALCAVYATMCLLVYQGQWQFVFPSALEKPAPAAQIAQATHLPIAEIHFDVTEEGTPQLNGWWIPASAHPPGNVVLSAPGPPATGHRCWGGNAKDLASSPPAHTSGASTRTILFLPNPRKGMRGSLDALAALHTQGLNIFTFDYRGTGLSRPPHPTEARAHQDTAAALTYLTVTRHIPPTQIILYGAEAASALALYAAAAHPQLAGLILENPQPSLAAQVRREQHIHLLPMALVFTKRFAIPADTLAHLPMPKLIFSTDTEPEYLAGAKIIAQQSAPPKQLVQIPANTPYTQPAWSDALRTFLATLR